MITKKIEMGKYAQKPKPISPQLNVYERPQTKKQFKEISS